MARHTVLVVEDNDDLRSIFSSALSVAGFAVKQAADGLAALQYLDSETPDVIVLDLFLPTISGFVVHQDIAARMDLRHVPVIVVTAATPEHTDTLKVDCVMYKPVLPDVLVNVVRKWLRAGLTRRS